MSDFPNGVTYYKPLQATINMSFPEGCIACKYCRFAVKDRNSGLDNRFTCLLTWEYLYNLSYTGQNCPLRSVEE